MLRRRRTRYARADVVGPGQRPDYLAGRIRRVCMVNALVDCRPAGDTQLTDGRPAATSRIPTEAYALRPRKPCVRPTLRCPLDMESFPARSRTADPLRAGLLSLRRPASATRRTPSQTRTPGSGPKAAPGREGP